MGVILIQILIFILYVGYIIKNWGILKSISDSYYYLPQNKQFYFTLFCWGVGLPLLILPHSLFFLAGAGFGFTSVASDYKVYNLQKITRNVTWWVHHIGASVGILFSFIGIWALYGNPFSLLAFMVLFMIVIKLKIKNKLWWIEMLAFINILIGLLIK